MLSPSRKIQSTAQSLQSNAKIQCVKCLVLDVWEPLIIILSQMALAVTLLRRCHPLQMELVS